jgi:hypothetical protein
VTKIQLVRGLIVTVKNLLNDIKGL